MHSITRWTGTALVVALAAGCAQRSALVESVPASGARAVLLVSLDGFRADYYDPQNTPGLARLARRGVRAEAMVPSFPTKTFPNHFTLVTGLVPDHHGVVANNMWDPQTGKSFGLGDRAAVGSADWYEGIPVWQTAERLGLATAPMFWPGSEAALGGHRPTYWLPYDGDMPYPDRVAWVLDRIEGRRGPPAAFATLYFDAVDVAGHRHGPDAPATRAAVAMVDSMIGLVLDGLAERALADRVDVIVVSDHGMSQLSPDRVIFLDDYLDLDSVRVVDWSPVLALWPEPEDVDTALEALAGLPPSLAVYRRSDIPAAYEFGTHRRVAPIVGIAEPGWSVTTREYFARNADRFTGGTHGYDHQSTDMRALFVAAGPSFRALEEPVVPFPNTDVYELMMRILALPPQPGDGDFDRVAHLLR